MAQFYWERISQFTPSRKKYCLRLVLAGYCAGSPLEIAYDERMDAGKNQSDAIPDSLGLPPDVIVSPDTQRSQRIPPGQSRTRKWPVLDASGPPQVNLDSWQFRLAGLVNTPMEWCWKEFLELPRCKVFADFQQYLYRVVA